MDKFKNRIVIIEQDNVSRELLCSWVESSDSFLLVNSYANYETAMQPMKSDFPDIIVLGLSFPEIQGVKSVRDIKRLYGDVNLLVITECRTKEIIFNTLSSGANGYILRTSQPKNFLRHLITMTKGGSPLSPMISKVIVESLHRRRDLPLTQREDQVLGLITLGNSYSQIASELKISKQTSKTHIRNIYRKLNVKNKLEVVKKALEGQIIPMSLTSDLMVN